MTTTPKKPRVVRTNIKINDHTIIPVYAGTRVTNALNEVTIDMDIYKGVKLTEVLEAVYEQGKKDGTREAFETIDLKIANAKTELPHRNPGQPKKKKKK